MPGGQCQGQAEQAGEREVDTADGERQRHHRRGDQRGTDELPGAPAAEDAARRPEAAEEGRRTPEPRVPEVPQRFPAVGHHRPRQPEQRHAGQVRGDLHDGLRIGQVRRALTYGQQPGALDHADLALRPAGQHEHHEGHEDGPDPGDPHRDGPSERAPGEDRHGRAEIPDAGARAPDAMRPERGDHGERGGPDRGHEPSAAPQLPAFQGLLYPVSQHQTIAANSPPQVMTARSRPCGGVFPTMGDGQAVDAGPGERRERPSPVEPPGRGVLSSVPEPQFQSLSSRAPRRSSCPRPPGTGRSPPGTAPGGGGR